ncbi:hypothetical protein HN358_00460 [Candidatus Uhrbacteria bacterium]|jgi:hypothetical protein|nr:hypothetical protein [Candidatus Uhrbacteria bacterium]MBT7717686.1 hypothetical protein [Candidatus Uhrbacteria bacterium]
MDTPVQDSEARRAAREAARDAKMLERARESEREALAELAEIEAGEFGFLVKYEKREDTDPVETELSQEFWEVLGSIELSDEEHVRERRFVLKVCEALSKHKDDDLINILWDIDDTMGQNDKNYDFIFRPTFLPMLELIKSRYQNAQHGLLTDRKNWESPGNKEIIDTINERWELSKDLLMSSQRNIPAELRSAMLDTRSAAEDLMVAADDLLPELEAQEEADRLMGLLGSISESQAGKMVALHNAGMLESDSIIVVDDYELPLYLGDRGVYVDMSARAKLDE